MHFYDARNVKQLFFVTIQGGLARIQYCFNFQVAIDYNSKDALKIMNRVENYLSISKVMPA